MACDVHRRALRISARLPCGWWYAVWLPVLAGVSACTASEELPESQLAFVPSEVIDLGALLDGPGHMTLGTLMNVEG